MNDQNKIESMELNEGKEVTFQIEDGTQYSGKISSVPNSEHYYVIVKHNSLDWGWYVREEAIK
jgi:hypothetical protein